MPVTLPRSPAHDDYETPWALTDVLSHLDAVYSFALTLTDDAERAEELTEDVLGNVHDDPGPPLGGPGLRNRLLARCVTAYTDAVSSQRLGWSGTPRRMVERSGGLRALLLGLPWDERAAVVLVDQLGLTYSDGAAVLGTSVAAFRARLHRGRSILIAAYSAGAR